MADDRDKPVLADWSLHPGHQIMRKRLIEAREDYYTNLAKTLYGAPDTIGEADLRCKAAFFRGAIWILNEPVFTRKALERATALDEGEPDE